ncbi:hypothetical protein, partial [Alicyclobacillus shizuokensis]|uniref:hypothetical protein n=1 Tax=Alicyclobacillus shizuokensis TaxID=392014 RepID=UPI001C3F4192
LDRQLPGKIAAALDKQLPGKIEEALDRQLPAKIEEALDRQLPGKIAAALDEQLPGKIEAALDRRLDAALEEKFEKVWLPRIERMMDARFAEFKQMLVDFAEGISRQIEDLRKENSRLWSQYSSFRDSTEGNVLRHEKRLNDHNCRLATLEEEMRLAQQG